MSQIVRIRQDVVEGMLVAARGIPQQECCGVLGGRDAVITTVFPAENALASGTAFEISPRDLFHIFRAMRAAGLEHLGIYHSHPAGANTPSARDIECAYYPEAAYFILSPLPETAQPVRAFAIRDGQAAELKIVIV